MSNAYGIKALQPVDATHILGFATARAVADDALFEVWNGPTNADLKFTLDKDGQLQGANGSVSRPTYAFENDKDCGLYRIGANNIGFAINAAKVLDIATTGLTVTGTLAATILDPTTIRVTAAGPHAIGGATVDYVRDLFTGDFTSGGASDSARGAAFAGAITGASGDTSYIAGVSATSTVTTQATDTVGVVAQLYLAEPNITVGSGGAVTDAATLYIAGAPTEGTNNAALIVGSGDVLLGGRFGVGETRDGTTPHFVLGSWPQYTGWDCVAAKIGGYYTSNGGDNFAAHMAFTGRVTAAEDDTILLSTVYLSPGGIITQDKSDTIGVVSSLWIAEPLITKGATDTITSAATVYIATAPTEGTHNYGLFVDGGHARFDQIVLAGAGGTGLLGTGYYSPSTSCGFMSVGATYHFVGSDSASDTTNKNARFVCAHYTIAEEPVACVTGYSSSSGNTVSIGGGTSSCNAASTVYIYTATDATTTTGTLRFAVGSSGTVGIGAAGASNYLFEVKGTYSSTPSAATSAVMALNTDLTVAGAGATSRISLFQIGGTEGASIAMYDAAETVGVVATMNVSEPNITKPAAATLTLAATVYIASAPTEGTSNFALYVNSGDVQVNGKMVVGGGLNDREQARIGGAFTSGGSDSYATTLRLATSLTGAAEDTSYLTMLLVDGAIITQTAAETIGIIASAFFDEPNITKNVTTITRAATVYIASAPTEGDTNAALYIVSGLSYFGGLIESGVAAGSPVMKFAAVTTDVPTKSPETDAEVGWLEIQVGANTRYIPVYD